MSSGSADLWICVAGHQTPEEITCSSLEFWTKLYCSAIKHANLQGDSCLNAVKLGICMLDVLEQFHLDPELGGSSFVDLYVGLGVGTVRKAMPSGTWRCQGMTFCRDPVQGCSITHPRAFSDLPAWPQFEYIRAADRDMLVQMQDRQDGLFDAPAAKQREDMQPHAPGLDYGPSLRTSRQAGHISTAQKQAVHGAGQDVRHMITDMVTKLQEDAKLSATKVLT